MQYLLAGLLAYLTDGGLKAQVNAHQLSGEQKTYFNGKLIIRNCHNFDGAFGLFRGHRALGRRISASVLLCVFFELFYSLRVDSNALIKLGLSLVAGGGSSNFNDRRQKGYVTDYISFGFRNQKWKDMVFNLSDFFILAGVLCYLAGKMISIEEK